MKQYIITVTCPLLLVCFLAVSCMTKNRMIRDTFKNLEGKEDITVVLVGNSLSGKRWLSETVSVQGNYLKRELGELLDSRISIINSSYPDDTVNNVNKRVQEDIISYRPDIVLLMLGLIDSTRPGLEKENFREQVKEFYGTLKKHDLFVVVLTTNCFRDTQAGYDSRIDRLREINEIIIWEAGHHYFPVIDVGSYLDRLRISDPYKYRSMFRDEYLLNEQGQVYFWEYVMKHFRKAFEKSSTSS